MPIDLALVHFFLKYYKIFLFNKLSFKQFDVHTRPGQQGRSLSSQSGIPVGTARPGPRPPWGHLVRRAGVGARAPEPSAPGLPRPVSQSCVTAFWVGCCHGHQPVPPVLLSQPAAEGRTSRLPLSLGSSEQSSCAHWCAGFSINLKLPTHLSQHQGAWSPGRRRKCVGFGETQQSRPPWRRLARATR